MSTSRYKFKLKNPSATDALTIIFVKWYVNKKRFTASLGNDSRINPKDWNEKKQRAKHNVNINRRIDKVIDIIETYRIKKEINNDHVDFDELRTLISGAQTIVSDDNESDIPTVLEYLDKTISGMQSGSIKYKGNVYDKRTVDAYRVLKAKLLEYCKHKGIKSIDFNSIDYKFYSQFERFFYSKGFSGNYFGNQIKNLKSLLNRASKEYDFKDDFKDFNKIQKETTHFVLNDQELEALLSLNVRHIITDYKPEKLQLSKDIFLLQCNTALRISDVIRIRGHHIKRIDDVLCISLTTKKKPRKDLVIPINDVVYEILNRYNFSIPKAIEQHINDHIKVICKAAGINEIVEKVISRGGKDIIERRPKYELISNHTGRRTAATNMYLKGIPPIEIIKITGHSTIKMLLRYIKITSQEAAVKASQNPFFKRSQISRAL